jgi:DNA-binding transcriptional ArsR family regulator
MRRDVFQAIADPTRREIIDLLVDKNPYPMRFSYYYPAGQGALLHR